MIELAEKYYTKEEYFALQEQLEEKIEYHQGRIYAMAGGSPEHNLIGTNMTTALNIVLDDSKCFVYNGDQQISLAFDDRYVYADAVVVCGEQEFEEPKPLKLKNPMLIVEVLSKSTAKHDKTSKFQLYRKIASFKEYVLIHADQITVEAYYWEEANLWRISSAHKLSDSIYLYSIDKHIAVKDIYKRIVGLKEGPFI